MLPQVLSHYKGVTKPTWQNVMSRVYAREIVADMRTFRGTKEMPSPRSGTHLLSSSQPMNRWRTSVLGAQRGRSGGRRGCA